MDYKKTVNLPKTDFPMKANLPEREPEMQARWEEADLYGRLRKERRGAKKFILHDGPPYANGRIHMGTATNKVLKDFIVRHANMKGFDAPYVPGWDTHGMPIEHKAIEELGLDRRNISPAELRNQCRDFALGFIEVMTEQFKRLGVMGDWDNPYVTLDPEYEARQILVFGEMARKGYIYKGLKSVYWCPQCETALAEAEIEYAEKRSPSIYVTFDVVDGKGRLPQDAKVVIWTTTPWTIPANVAIALHPDVTYQLVETKRGMLLMAEDLVDTVLEKLGLGRGAVLGAWKGRELEGVVCRHPLFDRDSLVVLGEHVTTEEGTGCVHTAPGHGQEDFEVGERYNLPVIVPIDDRGVFTREAGPFAGLRYDEANKPIAEALDAAGALLRLDFITHQYAHCWRCKDPVVWRATEQWFASIDGFRRQALEAIGTVEWIPHWGETRITNMVADRRDWCISRQRAWGVPIPIFYCAGCGEQLLNETSIAHVAELFRREGSNIWFEREAAELVPPGVRCARCGSDRFRKETDIMDVWFDSGSSHAAVLEPREELTWPADMYLEGSDQHRGWFQSSLLTAVATRGAAPYRKVLTHGFVVDGDGRKMSKSLGNVVQPEEVIRQYGADIMRLWVASTDYTGDMRISPDILKQLAEVYRKIRNTLRFLLGNLYDFDPQADGLPYEELEEFDRWALNRAAEVLERVDRAYDRYQYHQVYQSIHNFCVVDLSAFYLDVSKDRLYTSGPASRARRSAQTALYQVARLLTGMLAPILPHTADEVWGYLPRLAGDPESVHLARWPEAPAEWRDEALARRWAGLLEVRDVVLKALEEAKGRGINKSTEAALTLYASEEVRDRLEPFADQLETVFIAARVEVRPAGEEPAGAIRSEAVPGVAVTVEPAPGTRCERCYVVREEVGQHPRHKTLCARCAETVEREFAHVLEA